MAIVRRHTKGDFLLGKLKRTPVTGVAGRRLT